MKTGRKNQHFFNSEQVRELAERVREFRREHGLTQKALARSMGLGKWGARTVRRIENLEHSPWARTFERFVKVESKHEKEQHAG